MVTNDEQHLNTKLLDSIFQTSKKTIQEYVYEINRYCRFKSVQHQRADGSFLDYRGRLIDLYEACIQQDAHLASVLDTLHAQLVGERYMLAMQNDHGKYFKGNVVTYKMLGS